MHKMSNKNNIINEMNRLGKEKIPFLFIIDFERQNPLLFPIDDINTSELKYYLEGISNVNTADEAPVKKVELKKYPIPVHEYSKGFSYILENINLGNSYLLNYTAETPIEINLTLNEIFYFSRAKYKLLYNDLFVCFSPETFVKINNGLIYSYPMKGTIDASIENAEQVILNDVKETAEHYTIVDLIRNDLGIVSKHVRVEKFRFIDRLKTSGKELLQVSSEIVGELENNYNERIGDILFALLPAGSVTGAPKEKTVEIILKAENYKRGYYTGVFGIFDGINLNSAVMIRFIENTPKGMVYKSGGGITSFSSLESEYNEMIDKVYVPVIRNN